MAEPALPAYAHLQDSSGAVLYLSGFVSNAPKRTVRLVLFTGEEQGLLGSAAYAQKVADELAQDNQKKVVAVFNMDMIAYDNGEPATQG